MYEKCYRKPDGNVIFNTTIVHHTMKINIIVDQDLVDAQIFDCFYAYLQSMTAPEYNSPIDVKFNAPHESTDFNILCRYLPENVGDHELSTYDLIFLCNGGEPLNVTTPAMDKLITHKKVYLIANSFVDQTHDWHEKIIWMPLHVQMCRDRWTRCFYPQYHDNMKNRTIVRQPQLVAINGSIRTNRRYFFDLLTTHLLSVPQRSNIGTKIHKLNDASCESLEDTQFRIWINNQYNNDSVPEPDKYYHHGINVGVDNKFGTIVPGHFIIPEYFEYSAVIFPEVSWLNDELAITEKASKCFYAKSMPFPIGGASTNRLYNEIGFYTAWNLLPDQLKQFDKIKNHVERYHECIKAIQWLHANPEVFDSESYHDMVDQNFANFLTCDCDHKAIHKLYDMIAKKLLVDRGIKI